MLLIKPLQKWPSINHVTKFWSWNNVVLLIASIRAPIILFKYRKHSSEKSPQHSCRDCTECSTSDDREWNRTSSPERLLMWLYGRGETCQIELPCNFLECKQAVSTTWPFCNKSCSHFHSRLEVCILSEAFHFCHHTLLLNEKHILMAWSTFRWNEIWKKKFWHQRKLRLIKNNDPAKINMIIVLNIIRRI